MAPTQIELEILTKCVFEGTKRDKLQVYMCRGFHIQNNRKGSDRQYKYFLARDRETSMLYQC